MRQESDLTLLEKADILKALHSFLPISLQPDKGEPAMSKKNPDPRPARTEPTLKQWEALYEVGGNLKKLAPWRALADRDILVLQLPGQKSEAKRS